MSKVSEAEFIKSLGDFLTRNEYVHAEESHFGKDNDKRPDVELALNREYWVGDFPDYLLLEAKSHHSKDAPNTINKIFGQLLKETGKKTEARLGAGRYCLGVVFPEESAEWTDDNGKRFSQPSGPKYYRSGFNRIDRGKYVAFGELVDARFVLSFSMDVNILRIYKWADFYDSGSKCLLELPDR